MVGLLSNEALIMCSHLFGCGIACPGHRVVYFTASHMTILTKVTAAEWLQDISQLIRYLIVIEESITMNTFEKFLVN